MEVTRARSDDRPRVWNRRPAGGARQVIDSRIIVTGEHRRTNAGSIAIEIDVGQAPAVTKSIIPNAGDAVGERDAGQPGAIERIVPDAGDAIADRDVWSASSSHKKHNPRCW